MWQVGLVGKKVCRTLARFDKVFGGFLSKPDGNRYLGQGKAGIFLCHRIPQDRQGQGFGLGDASAKQWLSGDRIRGCKASAGNCCVQSNSDFPGGW